MDIRKLIGKAFSNGIRGASSDSVGRSTDRSHDEAQVELADLRHIEAAVNAQKPLYAAWLRFAYVNPTGRADRDRDAIIKYAKHSIQGLIEFRQDKIKKRILNDLVPIAVRTAWHEVKGKKFKSYREIEAMIRVKSFNKTYKPVFDHVVEQLKKIDAFSLKQVENTTAN